MSIFRCRPFLPATLFAVGFGCISSEVDLRCTIIAALRAMGQEKASAEAFVPLLQEAAANPWGEDIPDAASTALNRLEAATTR